MTSKSKGESIRKKLLDVSTKRNVRYANIETAFLIERLVARLVADKFLADHLVFKGGFVGFRVYHSPRYTIDLDALLVKSDPETILEKSKLAVQADLNDGVWFRFEEEVDLTTQGEYGGVRQVYRAGIGEVLKNIKRAQIINFDVGIGDPVTPSPKNLKMEQLLLAEEEFSWSVYPIETMCAEKIHALVAHGDANSRSKDIYDLSLFLKSADSKVLNEAISNCFNFRNTEVPDSLYDCISQLDTTRLERGWASAVASVANAPQFKTTFNSVLDLLKAYDGAIEDE